MAVIKTQANIHGQDEKKSSVIHARFGVTYFLSFVEFLPLGAMLARNLLSSCVLLSVRPSVRPTQAGIVSKRSTGRIELVFYTQASFHLKVKVKAAHTRLPSVRFRS